MSALENIKVIRRKKNMTQNELARLVGVSPQTVFRWEQGQRSPRAEELQRLAEVLGTPVAYLMDLETDASEHRKPVDKVEPVQAEINFEPTDKVDTALKTSVDKGTLRYKFSNGQEIEVPNTPEMAEQFWARVDKLIGLQPQAAAAV